MNAGAAAASGDVVLFLHADTVLPAGALAAIRGAVADDTVIGGGFLKRYDGGGRLLRLCGLALNHVRTRWWKAMVGTQAMFLRREVFRELGGYRDWPLLEDVDLSDRMRRRGQVVVLPLHVIASSRRYLQRGALRQILVNGLVLVLFRLGVGPDRLVRLYQGLR